MDLMADAVAGLREEQASLFGDALDKSVVVGVLKAGLEGVVVYVSHRQLGAYTLNAHCFKFKIRHGARCVLSKGLINSQTYLGAGDHFAADKMALYQLLTYCHSHM